MSQHPLILLFNLVKKKFSKYTICYTPSEDELITTGSFKSRHKQINWN